MVSHIHKHNTFHIMYMFNLFEARGRFFLCIYCFVNVKETKSLWFYILSQLCFVLHMPGYFYSKWQCYLSEALYRKAFNQEDAPVFVFFNEPCSLHAIFSASNYSNHCNGFNLIIIFSHPPILMTLIKLDLQRWKCQPWVEWCIDSGERWKPFKQLRSH